MIRFCIVFLLLAFLLVSAEDEEDEDIIIDDTPVEVEWNYKYFGSKVFVGKSLGSGLIPNLIPYRFHNPNELGLAQELRLHPLLTFEVSVLWGYYFADGNPWYCLDCTDKSQFFSESNLRAVDLKYGVYAPKKFKTIWALVSYETIEYEWNYHSPCLCDDVEENLRSGNLDANYFAIGLSAESYFYHTKWVIYGGALTLKLPVQMNRNMSIPDYVDGALEKRNVPILDLQLRMQM